VCIPVSAYYQAQGSQSDGYHCNFLTVGPLMPVGPDRYFFFNRLQTASWMLAFAGSAATSSRQHAIDDSDKWGEEEAHTPTVSRRPQRSCVLKASKRRGAWSEQEDTHEEAEDGDTAAAAAASPGKQDIHILNADGSAGNVSVAKKNVTTRFQGRKRRKPGQATGALLTLRAGR
jgi:hypothetical protein